MRKTHTHIYLSCEYMTDALRRHRFRCRSDGVLRLRSFSKLSPQAGAVQRCGMKKLHEQAIEYYCFDQKIFRFSFKGKIYVMLRQYLLGCNGRIYGVAWFQRAFVVQTQRTWERLRLQHRAFKKTLPYAPKTVMVRLLVTKKLSKPLAFRHPCGAVNVVVCYP